MWCSCLLVFVCFCHIALSSDLHNVIVKRKIVAESHILYIDSDITVETAGSSTHDYLYLVDAEIANRLSYIGAKVNSKTDIEVTPTKAVNGHSAFIIRLPKNSVSKIKFTVSTIFTRTVVPKPANITQAELQYVEFSANVYYLSSYVSERQETSVVLAKGEVLFYSTEPSPVKKTDNKITYGPFTNIPAFSKQIGLFNFENGYPFLAVTSLKRNIEISQWGNIAIEDQVDISHFGANLEGPFSRLDYQRGIGRHASVDMIKTVLPAAAVDIYYRDEIGNISTSNVKQMFNSVEVELRPRFPLFGGWKTHYILGYNLPAHQNLYKKDGRFALKIRFIDYMYDDLMVDEMTLRIILPETVTNVKFEAPFPVERMPDEIEKTYLDISGRIVIVVKKKNLIENYIKDFTIYYDFNMINMFREPAMLITAFFILFAAIIVYVRLDFSLSKDKSSEVQERIQAIVDDIINLQNKRSAIYQTYEDVVSNYKANKDINKFQSEFSKVENEHKTISQKISSCQHKLQGCWNEGAEKTKELQALDQRYYVLLQEGVGLAKRVIANDLRKSEYQTKDTELSSKKLGLVEKMEHIAESL